MEDKYSLGDFIVRRSYPVMCGMVVLSALSFGQPRNEADTLESHYRGVSKSLLDIGLRELGAFDILRQLESAAPTRVSGTPGFDKARDFVRQWMTLRGIENVHLQDVVVPRWERGSREQAGIVTSGQKSGTPLAICALGGSVPTSPGGLSGKVVEVRSFEELAQHAKRIQGRFVFYNIAMDPLILSTRDAYRAVVRYRTRGAMEAAKYGAVAVLLRSLTLARDDVPHTGTVRYDPSLPRIPAAALGPLSAETLARKLQADPEAQVQMRLRCRALDDGRSSNIIGEIRGSEHPDEIILIGAHLDTWDVGGAHDDGAGCAHVLEALNLIRRLGVKPKRTIRAVLFTNEEFGARGAEVYASSAGQTGERHIAALESDHGGFAPRGFNIEADSATFRKFSRWRDLFEDFSAGRFTPGFSAADIEPLVKRGVPGIGLDPEDHRYFDYHHAASDTIDKVNPRELELGAIAIALLSLVIAETGIN